MPAHRGPEGPHLKGSRGGRAEANKTTRSLPPLDVTVPSIRGNPEHPVPKEVLRTLLRVLQRYLGPDAAPPPIPRQDGGVFLRRRFALPHVPLFTKGPSLRLVLFLEAGNTPYLRAGNTRLPVTVLLLPGVQKE